MQKIETFLWFNDQAEEAVAYYIDIFDDGKIVSTMPGPDGSVMVVSFELFGQRFVALNGGPMYTFTPAISMYVHCVDQAEVDRYWEALIEGGEEQPCGWLVDRYGLSWQIIPERLMELLGDSDPGRSGRAMAAMLQMHKIDVAALEAAASG